MLGFWWCFLVFGQNDVTRKMKSFTPVWNSLVDSSLWEEKDHVFKVFIGMLALKSMDNIVHEPDPYKLSRRLHMPFEKVKEALDRLSSPDPLNPLQPYRGARIKPTESGWLILNGQKYIDEMRKEKRRRQNAAAQAKYRASKALSGPSQRERTYTKEFIENGPESADNLMREEPQ